MNTGMRALLAALDTAIDAGVSSILEIKQVTDPYPLPKQYPAVFLDPKEPEKMKESNDTETEVLWHRYPVEIVVWNKYITTEEESLVHSTNGLIKVMEDIETLLESNMLGGILQNADCRVITYNFEERRIADGIYTRAGKLLFTGETIPYRSTISRS
jgi:hypothetical protein